MHPSDDLPEDHEALMRLAQDTESYAATYAALPRERVLPRQMSPDERRVIAIPDEAGALVTGPLVGFATHGR